MKKILFTILVFGCAIAAQAQNEELTAILQHGEEVSVFKGLNALVKAHNAAEDGDVITLSAGTFNPATITKGISIYGAGFEANEETGADVTLINNTLQIGAADLTVSNVHIEGLRINGFIDAPCENTSKVEHLVVTKCYWSGGFHCFGEVEYVDINNCIIMENVYSDNKVATSLALTNCFVGGDVKNFTVGSSVVVDHCIVCGGEAGPVLYKNTILTYRYANDYYGNYWGAFRKTSGATVQNCIYSYGISSNNIVQDCFEVNYNPFADANNATYSEQRTFELLSPEEWVGTDGTEIGIRGGNGWSKTPSTPVVKNLNVEVQGMNLKVNYDANVR